MIADWESTIAGRRHASAIASRQSAIVNHQSSIVNPNVS
jgi:hypothetical protein